MASGSSIQHRASVNESGLASSVGSRSPGGGEFDLKRSQDAGREINRPLALNQGLRAHGELSKARDA